MMALAIGARLGPYEVLSAIVAGLSSGTIKRDWRLAKLWLLHELEGEGR
jgi:hypothetical protein